MSKDMKTNFNPIPNEARPAGPVKRFVETRYNPLTGTLKKKERATENERQEKSENVYPTDKPNQVLEDEVNIKEELISEQKAKVGKSYPSPENYIKPEKEDQLKNKFNPLDINNNEKFDMLNVDQTPKKKNFWQRLFS